MRPPSETSDGRIAFSRSPYRADVFNRLADRNETEEDGTDADFALYQEPDVDADDEDKAKYAFARWMIQRDTYEAQFKTWARSILFLLGKQWLEWDERSKRYAPEQNVPKWRERPVTNLVFAVYRAAIAKLTKQKPALDCVPPQNGDSDDRASAAIGNALLEFYWRYLGTSKLLGKAIGWLLTCGNAYVDTYWDVDGGKAIPMTTVVPQLNPETGEMEGAEVAADEQGNPKLDETGRPDFDAVPDTIFEGEIAHRLVSPLRVRFNPGCTDQEEAEEWLVGDIVPVAEAAAEFDIDPEEIQLNEDDALSQFEDLIASSSGADTILGLVQPSGNSRDQVVGDRCLVLRYYRKPCKDYPDGRHWVQINRTPVPDPETGDFEQPLPEGFWPPLVHIGDVPVPGQVHSLGLISQCVGLNREYNGLNGRIKEHNNTMARGGKWIVTRADANLKITTDPGQKLVSDGYLMGMPPTQAKMEALPAQVYQERERILNDLFLVSGVNQVAMGQVPDGVTAGRAFLVMQEATDSVLAPTLTNIELAMQEIGRRELVLAQRHVSEKRIIKVRGAMGQWEIRSFTGADLGDGIDVQVQMGSSFPWSKAARLDTILSAIQTMPGLVVDPKTQAVDTVKFARLTDIGGLQAFQMEGDPDMIEVQMEHSMFEQFHPETGEGSMPQLGFWQNHNTHFTLHAELMKRDRTRMEKWSPVAQQAFIQHMLMHLQAIQGQAQQLMPSGGGGAPPGAPGAPGAPPGGAPPGGPDPSNDPSNQQDPQAPGGAAADPGASFAGGPPPGGPGAQLTPADFAAAGQ